MVPPETTRKHEVNNRVFCLCTLIALTALQGCGPGNNKNAPASQVAARVNSGEITIYRVNSALASFNLSADSDPKILARARRDVLDRLIDQELAAQAAEESKLDRTPEVMQAIEAGRREILARAWLEQVATTLPKPETAEVSRYYANHPELFARRRIYNLQQIIFTAQPQSLIDELKQKAAADVPIQQIAHWLDARQVKFTEASGTRAAEQISLDILPELDKAKDGQTLVIAQPNATLVIRVVSSTLQPVDETQAAPRIRKFLAGQGLTEAIAAEMKRLKQNASITYAGEFSTMADKPQAQAVGMKTTAMDASPSNTNVTDKQGANP